MQETSCQHHETHRSERLSKDLMVRLNKIEGQIRGIKNMVENGVYCDDILTQVSSVQSALASFNKRLLESHIKSCVVERIKNDDNEIIDEFLKTLSRVMRT